MATTQAKELVDNHSLKIKCKTCGYVHYAGLKSGGLRFPKTYPPCTFQLHIKAETESDMSVHLELKYNLSIFRAFSGIEHDGYLPDRESLISILKENFPEAAEGISKMMPGQEALLMGPAGRFLLQKIGVSFG